MTTDDGARDDPPWDADGDAFQGRGPREGGAPRRGSIRGGARHPELTATGAAPGRPGAARDSADIANLLRSLNDELRDDGDDEPSAGRVTGGGSDGRGYAPGATATAADGPMGAGGWLTSPPVVAVAIVAALGVGGGAIWWGGGDSPDRAAPPPSLVVAAGGAGGGTDSATPPSLISRSPGGVASDPATVTRSAPVPAPTQAPTPAPVASPPPSEQAAPAPRLLIPGQTATVVRPPPDPAPPSMATVVVPPMVDEAPSPPRSPSGGSPPPPRAPTPKPAPVVRPPAAEPPPARNAASTPARASVAAPSGRADGGFAVQVGTFSVAANAESLVGRLERSGWRAYALDWRDSKGRTWRVVRVGDFADQAAARRAADGLRDKLSLSGQIVDIR